MTGKGQNDDDRKCFVKYTESGIVLPMTKAQYDKIHANNEKMGLIDEKGNIIAFNAKYFNLPKSETRLYNCGGLPVELTLPEREHEENWGYPFEWEIELVSELAEYDDF